MGAEDLRSGTAARRSSAPTATRSCSATFHPTFLYELLWNLAAAAFVIWADRRFRLGHGRAFALYVASYCLGRLWIELLRTDPANHFFGIRLNVFTAIDRRPGRGRLLRRTCAAGRARSSPAARIADAAGRDAGRRTSPVGRPDVTPVDPAPARRAGRRGSCRRAATRFRRR